MNKFINSTLTTALFIFSGHSIATEINANPLAIVQGEIAPSFLFEIKDSYFRAGPTLGFTNYQSNINHEDDHLSGSSIALILGGTIEYSFSGFEQNGYYLSTSLNFSNAGHNVSNSNLSCDISGSSLNSSAKAGHAWRFDNGFSFKLGAGLGNSNSLNNSVTCTDSNNVKQIDISGEKGESSTSLAFDAIVSYSF